MGEARRKSKVAPRGLAEPQCSAHRVPPLVTVLFFAANSQPPPTDGHQEDEAPVGDKESHEGASLPRHVEEQPIRRVQPHLQGEMEPVGTADDRSTLPPITARGK